MEEIPPICEHSNKYISTFSTKVRSLQPGKVKKWGRTLEEL